MRELNFKKMVGFPGENLLKQNSPTNLVTKMVKILRTYESFCEILIERRISDPVKSQWTGFYLIWTLSPLI